MYDAFRQWHRLSAITHGPPAYQPCVNTGDSDTCMPPDSLPPPCIPYKRHPQQPGDEGPAPASTYMQVSNFGLFCRLSMGSTYMCINLYASIYCSLLIQSVAVATVIHQGTTEYRGTFSQYIQWRKICLGRSDDQVTVRTRSERPIGGARVQSPASQ